MEGYTTNYVNLIADNLRERYDSGFPILKELIQNADDAKARTFLFARHAGFTDAVHPLLKGPGLWFFNDGEFKDSDGRALRSFGINSKAGDATAIGKFGLGMKSVFHLCEAIFYVAWDGAKPHRAGLTPWKQEDSNPHPEWEQSDAGDWQRLEDLGRSLVADPGRSWFLLWIPLRKKAHLSRGNGKETGAIISRFPGDEPGDLGFLDQESLALDLAEILPLLQHLERIEHRGDGNAFALRLKTERRILGQGRVGETAGEVIAGGDRPLLRFGGRSAAKDIDGPFALLKAREEWPRTWYRDKDGQERLAEDKTSPEGAVLFCAGLGAPTHSNLHWAVFLPVEQGGERLRLAGGDIGHSLILHGQFFIDAGRKKIHGLEDLHLGPEDIGKGRIDDGRLRQIWNQHLAQRVLLPLVIPALEHYIDSIRLANSECEGLTRALADSDWFRTFRGHVCSTDVWVRVLNRNAKPAWRRVQGDDRDRLRPLPSPPKSAAERPWQVFPRLAVLDLKFFDGDAPLLTGRPYQWKETELGELLAEVSGSFADGPQMDYFADFLEHPHGALPYRETETFQFRLVDLYRKGLRAADAKSRAQLAEKSRRLVASIDPKRRRVLAAELPEAVLRSLWEIQAPILLVPKGLDPTPAGSAVPEDETLRDWLRVLDRNLAEKGGDEDLKAILETVRGLLQTLDADNRGRFLRVHADLRVIAVRDARTNRQQPLSFARVQELREAGILFGFAQGLGNAALGLARRLAQVLPGASISLVQAPVYRELFGGTQDLPPADNGLACLIAVGKDASSRIGSVEERHALLEKADNPGNDADARRGLRYLLHGAPDHRADDAATLWFPGHDQHTAWAKLWGQLHSADRWSLIPTEFADTLPRNRWGAAGAQEIDARNLVAELRRTGLGINAPSEFTRQEREEILSQIEDDELWRRLPLHTCSDGTPVTASGDLVYLAPESGDPDDPLLAKATLIARAHHARVEAQQRQWLNPLDDSARIELALAAAVPATHWHTLLGDLGQLPDTIDADLRARLRGTAWLPTRDGGAVKPEDVIDLPPGLADEAQRLVGEHRVAQGPCYATPADLIPDLLQHPVWVAQGRALCASGTAGLGQLGLLLSDLPDYRIGPWTQAPGAESIELLARCDALPGWRLLAQARADAKSFDGETAWSALRDGLAKGPGPGPLRAAMDWLSQDTTGWNNRKAAFDRYLNWYKGAAQLKRVDLADLRLTSLNREWRVAAQLCAGAHDIDCKHVLDPAQVEILAGAIRRADTGQAEAGGMPTPVTQAEFEAALMDTPQILASYFKAWEGGWVAEPLIGLLIGLLGTRVRLLAEGYLQSRPFDLLMDEIPWQDLGGDPMRQTWMDGLSRERLMAEIQLAVRVLEGDCIEVPNLLGEWISVPIAREVGSLLVGGIHWMGGYRALIQFRRIDPSTFDESRLDDLLRGAAEALYAGLYDQPPVDLGGLCRDLSQSDQVEIQVARRLILDHVPFYLRQLTIGQESLRQALTRIDACRRRIAELETKGRDTQQERRSRSQAMDALAVLIERDADASAEVLAGVRAKLAQFQYDRASIPFELFQNADDAAVELGQIEAHPAQGCEVPDGARRLVVEQDAEGLRFLHWGRPINARGPVGFDGEGRGFGRDLEKMLVLSASDKQPGQGVTGKFGLGFKSVLLACDRPRILSGRLALEVVAGILPQPWRDSAGGRETMARHAPLGPRLPGTLIELPGVDPAEQDQVLERFRALAGVLCVFARALRSIRMCDGANGQDQELTWQPRCVLPGVEVGRLRLTHDDWGAETEALCVRMEGGTLLLALGPGGFRLLPKATPSLWVTAPLRETDGLGFACTAPFDLDPGRARLAGDSHQNLADAQGLGAAAGDALGALFERGRSDWPGLCRDLGLDPGLSPHDLWHSLWTCLTERWLGQTKDAAAALGRELVLALVKRLSARKAAVPNGLAGPFQALIDLGDTRYQLPKSLATPEAIATLGAWERFTAKYLRQHLVSEGQGRILKEGDMAKPATLGLRALVALVDPPKVAPEDADALGGIRLLTEDDRDWNSDEVKKRLGSLHFRTADDTWLDAAHLVAGAAKGVDKDEVLRYDLAPPGRRLHPDYWVREQGAAATVAFFLLARERLQAGTEDLAQWVLAAQGEKAQKAALLYLVKGQLGGEVARRVRGQGWLAEVPHDEAWLRDFEPDQQKELRRLLAADEQIDRGLESDHWSEPAAPLLGRIDLGEELGRIEAQWSQQGAALVLDYRQRLYPTGGVELAIDPETGRFDRPAWMTLLALGAFQGMGRTREEQHRGFIEECQHMGWWQTFADLDPKEHPERWMDVIEEYAEAQDHDEEWTQWIAQFPKLYKLRRWMDDYVELFLSIDRFDAPFTLDTLLAPRANPHFQGGGIEAPPLTRTLRVGGPLVIRELLHHGVIRSPLAVPHAYAPIQRIRDWFAEFGADVETSKDIHDLLGKHLGVAGASFGGAYDIPLRIVTANADRQRVLFR